VSRGEGVKKAKERTRNRMNAIESIYNTRSRFNPEEAKRFFLVYLDYEEVYEKQMYLVPEEEFKVRFCDHFHDPFHVRKQGPMAEQVEEGMNLYAQKRLHVPDDQLNAAMEADQAKWDKDYLIKNDP